MGWSGPHREGDIEQGLEGREEGCRVDVWGPQGNGPDMGVPESSEGSRDPVWLVWSEGDK